MADRRWSAGETVALIDAWRPLYNRRRGGESDVWVPANQRTRARSTGALATEDWRAVATAVNSFRTDIKLDPSRTHRQCKRRVERLKSRFGDEQLATPSWLGFVCPSSATTPRAWRGHSRLRLLVNAATEALAHGGGAAEGQARGGSAVAEGGSAAADDNGGALMGVGAAAANASDGEAVAVEDDGTATPPPSGPEEGGTATPPPSGPEEGGTATPPSSGPEEGGTATPPPSGPVDPFTADMGFLGGPIPKKRRTGASTSISAGAGGERAPSVKEELMREENARRARFDKGRPPAGGFADTAPGMAAALADILAAETHDVAVVEKLSEMFMETTTLYREIMTERIELQRQIVAALSSTTGGAAVPEPDAART